MRFRDNPLPQMPILGSTNSAENKDYDVKNMDQRGYNYLIESKTLWEKEKLLAMSNFSFSHYVFKSCLVLMRQNEYLWSKEFTNFSCSSPICNTTKLWTLVPNLKTF